MGYTARYEGTFCHNVEFRNSFTRRNRRRLSEINFHCVVQYYRLRLKDLVQSNTDVITWQVDPKILDGVTCMWHRYMNYVYLKSAGFEDRASK